MKFQSSENGSNFVCEKGTFSQIRSHIIFEDGKEVPVVLLPHGNSKAAASYHCRTLTQMWQKEGKPKSVISEVYKEVGGVLEAMSKSEIPWNCRQVYNACHSIATTTAAKSDSIFELLQQCKRILCQKEGDLLDLLISKPAQIALLPLTASYVMLLSSVLVQVPTVFGK